MQHLNLSTWISALKSSRTSAKEEFETGVSETDSDFEKLTFNYILMQLTAREDCSAFWSM
jgi:hypothetical protein